MFQVSKFLGYEQSDQIFLVSYSVMSRSASFGLITLWKNHIQILE